MTNGNAQDAAGFIQAHQEEVRRHEAAGSHEEAHLEQPQESQGLDALLKNIETYEHQAKKLKWGADYALLKGLIAAFETVKEGDEFNLDKLDDKDALQSAKDAFYNTTTNAIKTTYSIGTSNQLGLSLAVNGILGFPLRNILDTIMTGSDFDYQDIFPKMLGAVSQNVERATADYKKSIATVSYVPALAKKAGIDEKRIIQDIMGPDDVIRLMGYATGRIGTKGLEKEKWYTKEQPAVHH